MNFCSACFTPPAGFEFFRQKRLGAVLAAHQRGVLQRAREEKVVGRRDIHADADAGLIDIGRRIELRLLRHRVDAFDDHVRRGELDLGRAHRLDRQEHDVHLSGLQRLERLAGGVEST
jgi:hypothetical protein